MRNLEGILEFLKSIKKLDNVVSAESAANGHSGRICNTDTSGSPEVPVKFIDLKGEVRNTSCFDERISGPIPFASQVSFEPDSTLYLWQG